MLIAPRFAWVVNVPTISKRGKSWRAAVRYGGFNHTKTFASYDEACLWVDEQTAKALPDIKKSISRYADISGVIAPYNSNEKTVTGGPISTKEPWVGKQPSSELYILQNALGYIKIGRSCNSEARRSALETAAGIRVYLVAVVRDGGQAELRLHEMFKRYRGLGEWFRNVGAVRDGLSDALNRDLVFPISADAETQEVA